MYLRQKPSSPPPVLPHTPVSGFPTPVGRQFHASIVFNNICFSSLCLACILWSQGEGDGWVGRGGGRVGVGEWEWGSTRTKGGRHCNLRPFQRVYDFWGPSKIKPKKGSANILEKQWGKLLEKQCALYELILCNKVMCHTAAVGLVALCLSKE